MLVLKAIKMLFIKKKQLLTQTAVTAAAVVTYLFILFDTFHIVFFSLFALCHVYITTFINARK